MLKQFNASGASKVLESRTQSGTLLHVIDGSSQGSLEITDPRYLNDDLQTLLDLGLLDLEYGSGGRRLFVFKRVAARLVEQLGG